MPAASFSPAAALFAAWPAIAACSALALACSQFIASPAGRNTLPRPITLSAAVCSDAHMSFTRGVAAFFVTACPARRMATEFPTATRHAVSSTAAYSAVPSFTSTVSVPVSWKAVRVSSRRSAISRTATLVFSTRTLTGSATEAGRVAADSQPTSANTQSTKSPTVRTKTTPAARHDSPAPSTASRMSHVAATAACTRWIAAGTLLSSLLTAAPNSHTPRPTWQRTSSAEASL